MNCIESMVKTMISIFKVKDDLPAVVINNAIHYKLTKLEDFENLIPELKNLKEQKMKSQSASTTATTTRLK